MDKLGKRLLLNFLAYAHCFMFIGISQLKEHSISVDQARYATPFFVKYLDNSIIKENQKYHKTTLPHDLIFTKDDASTSDKHVALLYKEYNIHYRAFVGSLIYILSTRAL